LGIDWANRYPEGMRFALIMLGGAVLAVVGCHVGGQSAGQPTVGSSAAALITYNEAMRKPVAMGDATNNCPETQLSRDQVVAEIDTRLDEMYRKCVVREAKRGKAPGTVTIDIAILGDGSVQGATVSPGSERFRGCVGSIVETIHFPKFTAPRMGARYQFHTS
jgi:hypothetical protein